MRLQEAIPKTCRTETQTFVVLNSFYLFPVGARICAERRAWEGLARAFEGLGLALGEGWFPVADAPEEPGQAR